MANEMSVMGPGAHPAAFPRIVCLCGSTRFIETFLDAAWSETLAGNIVLSICLVPASKTDKQGGHAAELIGPEVAAQMDELHLRKIDLADEVLILNVSGYIGESTRRELDYARERGKKIRFLEEPAKAGEGKA